MDRAAHSTPNTGTLKAVAGGTGVSLKALVWLTQTWREEVKGDPKHKEVGTVMEP